MVDRDQQHQFSSTDVGFSYDSIDDLKDFNSARMPGGGGGGGREEDQLHERGEGDGDDDGLADLKEEDNEDYADE